MQEVVWLTRPKGGSMPGVLLILAIVAVIFLGMIAFKKK